MSNQSEGKNDEKRSLVLTPRIRKAIAKINQTGKEPPIEVLPEVESESQEKLDRKVVVLERGTIEEILKVARNESFAKNLKSDDSQNKKAENQQSVSMNKGPATLVSDKQYEIALKYVRAQQVASVRVNSMRESREWVRELTSSKKNELCHGKNSGRQ